jgi:Sigma-70 region 2
MSSGMGVIVAHGGLRVIHRGGGDEQEACPPLRSAGSREAPVVSGSPADRRLLDRLAAGDEQALADVYDRYSPLVYGTARRITADMADAAAVTETVFVELWTRATRYAASNLPLHALLAALAHHHGHRLVEGRRLAGAGARPVLACVAEEAVRWS